LSEHPTDPDDDDILPEYDFSGGSRGKYAAKCSKEGLTMKLDRIVCNPEILGGKPCIKGTRISVQFLLELFASGATIESVRRKYSHLEVEDIEQAFRYAAERRGDRVSIRITHFGHMAA